VSEFCPVAEQGSLTRAFSKDAGQLILSDKATTHLSEVVDEHAANIPSTAIVQMVRHDRRHWLATFSKVVIC
jgi:hypothetical protein